MVNIENKTCPYCGQIVMAEEGVDPRRRCRCAEAVKYSADQETLEDMQTLCDELFSETCNEVSAAFIPVDENSLHMLSNLCVYVNAGLFGKVNITLSDGSACIIKPETVQRRLTVKK